jgi:hypothetical protein
MRSKSILVFAVSFVLAAVALAQASDEKSPNPVFIPPDRLKWEQLAPQLNPGIMIADIWGDHAKSGYGSFLKFPAGFLSAPHTHTNNIRIVVISGTYTQQPEGKETMRMGPGSFVFQPGGSYEHVSGCDAASECLLFIQSTGPFDLVPTAAPAVTP